MAKIATLKKHYGWEPEDDNDDGGGVGDSGDDNEV